MPPLSLGQLFGLGIASSAAGQLMSIPTGLISQAFYKKNLERQVSAQKELIDYQNEYNSPSAQMERLAEAGLNPNLVYGSAAPAGTSGNASAPAGHSPSYDTLDVSQAMLAMQQMKQVNSTMNLQDANAEKARAEARFTNQQADRYNELVDTQIFEAGYRMDHLASQIGLNESSIQLQEAQKALAIADEQYRRGEIGLQTYRKQEIIAQTALYTSQKHLVDTQNYYADVEGQISLLELQYQKYFYNVEGGDFSTMKEMSENERNAALNKFKIDAEKAAARLGIEGSKASQWIDWVTTQIGKMLGGAPAAAIQNYGRRPASIHRVTGLQ